MEGWKLQVNTMEALHSTFACTNELSVYFVDLGKLNTNSIY